MKKKVGESLVWVANKAVLERLERAERVIFEIATASDEVPAEDLRSYAAELVFSNDPEFIESRRQADAELAGGETMSLQTFLDIEGQ